MGWQKVTIMVLLLGLVATVGCDMARSPVGPEDGEIERTYPGNSTRDSKSISAAMPEPQQMSEIAGTCYYDVNGNGIQDNGEPGIFGINILVDDEEITVTDEDGYYILDDLEIGTYYISVEPFDGLEITTDSPVEVDLVHLDEIVDFGFQLVDDFGDWQIRHARGLGYWKNSIRRVLEGRNRGNGNHPDEETLNGFVDEISDFGLDVLNIESLEEAYAILSTRGPDPVAKLSRHLLTAEFNYMNGVYINDNECLTRLFLLAGEFIITYSDRFSREEILTAKDIYEAFNEWDADDDNDGD